MAAEENFNLELQQIIPEGTENNATALRLQTNRGAIVARLHAAPGAGAVIWVGGASGGLDGPAGGIYPRLAALLVPDGIAALRLHYRLPNHLEECVLDTLLGIEYLKELGKAKIILVGHSFGGAVVISAGALSPDVTGVVPMSSQTYGTQLVTELAPRPILLLHGSADEILPDRCSRDIYARAQEPKTLKIYPGCRHGLDECRDQVDQDLLAWLRKVLL